MNSADAVGAPMAKNPSSADKSSQGVPTPLSEATKPLEATKDSPKLLIPSVEPRLYQETIFSTASLKNTLVVLPTGMGKTMVAAMLAAHCLQQHPQSKILFLAPTKPLVQQHQRTFQELLDVPETEQALFTGHTPPAKRQAQWQDARIIFSTPQGLENDLLSNRIQLDDVSLIIFDEAHRAVGEYSYVFVAERYEKRAKHDRILALTASPGTDAEKISEVCRNLHIEEIEVRSEQDPDVAPYVQEIDLEWVEVNLPAEHEAIRKLLHQCYLSKLEAVHKYGYLKVLPRQATKTTLLKAQGAFHAELSRGNKEFELLKSISLIAEALKVQHALELVETQGLYSLHKYLTQLQSQARTSKTKATKNLVKDPLFKTALIKTESLIEQEQEHPKLLELKKLILKTTYTDKEAKVIIFTQYRDQAVKIQEALSSLNVDARVFVGQAKRGATGMSQKEQKAMLAEFSDGCFPVLVATSVAEEGLDIPKVDLVVFYEPVPSAIRTVQRRGRTGRLARGRVVILVTKGTRDVGYRWSAHHKEKRMYRAIKEVKKKFLLGENTKNEKRTSGANNSPGGGADDGSFGTSGGDLKLTEFAGSNKPKIVADHREKGSRVLKSLVDDDVHLDLQQLAVGDFLLSSRCVVEYKRVPDFVDSIIDGRLLAQLKGLSQYSRPVIIIEGEEDLYGQRRIHPNAIRGMLATIAVSYGIPVMQTKSAFETASLLVAIAKREQKGGVDFQYHQAKPLSESERLAYVVAAIPNIGSQLAAPLLERFKSIKELANATIEQLIEVPGFGKKRAEELYHFLRARYEKE